MVKYDGLAHIGMIVKNMEATKKFYTEMLGFTAVEPRQYGECDVWFIANGNLVIECIHKPVYNENHGEGKFVHVAIKVTEGIEELEQKLLDYGVTWVQKLEINTTYNLKSMLFEGPEGEVIEVSQE